MRVGFSEREAQMAMLTMSQFTIGCVIEEQTRNKRGILKSETIEKLKESKGDALTSEVINTVENGVQDAFEFGLKLIVEGLKITDFNDDRS